MKTRDHNVIISEMQRSHLAQCTRLRQVSAEQLCTYLSPTTFDAVCSDLMRADDAGAGPLLTLLAQLKERRKDGKRP